MRTTGHLRLERLGLAPGQEWSTEPSGWRFAQTRAGSAYWLDATHPRELCPGEVVIVPPGSQGIVRASQLNQVLLDSFYFDPDQLCGFFTLAERKWFEDCQAGTEVGVQFLPSTHPLARSFKALAQQGEADSDLSMRVRLLELAVGYFDEQLPHPQQPEASEMSAQHRFAVLVAGMPDLELIRYRADKLAQLCGCSARHFNRLFHAQFGQSPRARQTELRLLKARQLLGSTDARVVEVAQQAGYHSASLFNASFKRRFGMSPTEWRRQANGGKPAK